LRRKGTQFRSVILSALTRGDLKVGDRLPTEMELMEKYGLSRGSLREGLASLVEEGILTRRRKAGTFVASLSPIPQSRIFALMVPGAMRESVFHQITRSVEDELHERGYSLLLCNHDCNGEKIKRYVLQLCQEHVAGVIFVPMIHPHSQAANSAALAEFEKVGIPFVLIDSAVSAQTLPQYSLVGSNGYLATREIVRHLAESGHKRIAYIRGLPEVFNSDQRYFGFRDEMRRLGLEVPEGYVKQLRVESVDVQGRAEVREFLAISPAPTAVVCVHDLVAINLMEEVSAMGLRVPRDLSVAGFDDIPLAGRSDPPLTTIAQPTDEEGRLAVRILFDKINQVQTGERQEFLPCRLVARGSCGAAANREPGKAAAVHERGTILQEG
jgi:GntR family transcriptional regulator, arabinose operon transcriptional repressor